MTKKRKIENVCLKMSFSFFKNDFFLTVYFKYIYLFERDKCFISVIIRNVYFMYYVVETFFSLRLLLSVVL